VQANSPEQPPAGLQGRIAQAIDQVRRRDLLSTHGFWTVFHAILGLGPDVTLLDAETGRRENALEHICRGGNVRGLKFIPTADGLDVQIGPQFVGQGHQDQFLAEMAQWGLQPDHKFVVLGKDYTFMDFIRHAKARARVMADQELGWTILCIGQYFGTDVVWTNNVGELVHFEDMVRYELDAPMDSAACGGTHRLFGLSWVYHLHLKRGGKRQGVWLQVAENTRKHVALARKYQNSDGSFSTSFFQERGNAPDMQLRINTTGHILEWLALALPTAELKAGWMQDAANALALMILDVQSAPMEGGTLYHAVHGLQLYSARAFGTSRPSQHGFAIPLPPEDSSELLPADAAASPSR
jgi:hypothetical protein